MFSFYPESRSTILTSQHLSLCVLYLFFGFVYFELIWKCPLGCLQNDALKDLTMHKLESPTMAEDGHCTSPLYVLLWWDPRAPFIFNTLDDGASEGLIARKEESPEKHPPPKLNSCLSSPPHTHTPTPRRSTELCHKVTLGKLTVCMKQAWLFQWPLSFYFSRAKGNPDRSAKDGARKGGNLFQKHPTGPLPFFASVIWKGGERKRCQ